MSRTRAIRFSNEEERQIDEFLKSNPFFDFSTMGRMAILSFIKDPKITVKPIKVPRPSSESARRNHEQPEQ